MSVVELKESHFARKAPFLGTRRFQKVALKPVVDRGSYLEYTTIRNPNKPPFLTATRYGPQNFYTLTTEGAQILDSLCTEKDTRFFLIDVISIPTNGK